MRYLHIPSMKKGGGRGVQVPVKTLGESQGGLDGVRGGSGGVVRVGQPNRVGTSRGICMRYLHIP